VTLLSTIAIFGGLLLMLFGVWGALVGRDPLGYAPPIFYSCIGAGWLAILAGIGIARFA
jgi:hypothetical protein